MKKKIVFIIVLLLLVGISASIVSAVMLDNDVQVEKNTTLTYYLDVYYDGVDAKGIESSDTTTADIKSGYIYVEDKIPEGLIFDSFVATEDGTIGAVKRSDGTSCAGYVVDGVAGLKYNEEKRLVSFKVKNLQAGCKLTIGINTITPASIDNPNTDVVETRINFYNTATATEESSTKASNTVHAWMGEENAELYEVKYEYDGEIPDGAPTVPPTNKYAENAKVGVEKDAILQGYRFTGWTTNDVEVTNGSFAMPNKTVTLKGSFESIASYNVKYIIDSDMPEGYVTQEVKKYYPNSNVKLDSLQKGDIFNGYKFLGWTTNDVEVTNDNDFIMPEKDVTITGKFELIEYKVSYAFQGVNIPANSDALLPKVKSYKPGEKVKLESEPQTTGYRFLGWSEEDNFEMPEKDIVIYGEWTIEKGQFEPTITKEIIDEKDSYKENDIVKFKIVITNTAEYDIHDVYVSENNDKSKFINEEGYSIATDHMAKIDSIKPNESVILYTEYKVTDEEGTISAETELIGALSDNDFILNADKEYKATSEFKVIKDKVPPSTEKSPITADKVLKYIIVSIISLLSILGLVLFMKKKKIFNDVNPI